MFSQVYRGGGDFPACIAGHMTKGALPPRLADPSWVCLRMGQADLPPCRDTWDTAGYGQQAVGTHPTGMHSCSEMLLLT